ncbi:MAG: YitT family protein [Comamonas sp.]
MTAPHPATASVTPSAPAASTKAAPAIPHTLVEDAAALFTGCTLISVGIALCSGAKLLTGGMVGLAFVLHYATDLPMGQLFFALNLPFYWLAWKKMGVAFTLKTFAAVLLLSLLTDLQPHVMQLGNLHPLYAAIAGGLLLGVGMLVLFRHRGSLGGIGIAALYLQDRYGWRAGKVQMALDCLILLAACATVEPSRVGWSIVAAITLNLALTMNHRPGRYQVV